MLPGSTLFNCIGYLLSSNNFSFTIAIVPVGGFKTLFAIQRTLVGIALGNLVFHQITSLIVQYILIRKFCFYPIKNRNCTNGCSIVIPPQHLFVVSIWANYSNSIARFWQ